MSEITAASTDTVRAIVSAFQAVQWPLPREEFVPIAEGLGWAIGSNTTNAIRFDTGCGTTPARGGVTVDADSIGQVTVPLTDRVRDAGPGLSAALASAAGELRAAVAEQLGAPVRAGRGSSGRSVWDLPNGGRIRLDVSAEVVKLVVLQERYADIERAEERLGIPDDRVVG